MKRLTVVAGLLLSLLAAAAEAETRVYIQNNTGRSLSIQPRTAAHNADPTHWLPPGSWGWGENLVPPYTRQEIVRIPRRGNFAYQNGRFYTWTEVVTTQGGGALHLEQRVRGSLLGHTLEYRVRSDANFYDSGDTDVPRWHQWGSIEVVYQSYRTPGTVLADPLDLLDQHQIEYIFNEDPPPPASAGSNVLNVLAYNVQMFPPGTPFAGLFGGQGSRADALRRRQHLLRYDVIIFSELFDNGTRQEIMDGLRDDWLALFGPGSFYRTSYMHRAGWTQDGGVVIVSRFPILEQDRIFYQDCESPDCLAAKGAVYAKISNGGRRYNVFGSHTQADYVEDGELYPATRASQLRQLKGFIDSRDIPWHEPVIVGGDLNVNRYNQAEFDDMLAILDVSFPQPLGHPYTSDPTINTFSGGSNRSYLDYLLYSNDHLRPIAATVETRVLRSRFKWNTSWHATFETRHFDLSDHFAVFGRLEFPPPTLEVFATGTDGDLVHYRYAPDSLWTAENVTQDHAAIGDDFRIQGRPVAVAQRRGLIPTLDVFGTSSASYGDLIHYYWSPAAGWRAENLTSDFWHKILGQPVVVAQERRGVPAVEVFGVGYRGHLIHYHWNRLDGWLSEDLTTDFPHTGLPLQSGLAALGQTRRGVAAVDVFGHDASGRLIHYFWSQQAGGEWRAETLTPVAADGSPQQQFLSLDRPAAVGQERGDVPAVDVFTVNARGEVLNYAWSQQPGGWTAQNLTADLGGSPILGVPAVAGQDRGGNHTLDVFGLGVSRLSTPFDPGGISQQRPSGELVHYYWAERPGNWGTENLIRDFAPITASHRVGGGLTALPDTRSGIAAVDLFAKGYSGPSLLHYFWSLQPGGTWKAENLTTRAWTSIFGDPAALAQTRYGIPKVDVFGRGYLGDLIHYAWTMWPGGWTAAGMNQPWTGVVPHAIVSDPVAVDPYGRDTQP